MKYVKYNMSEEYQLIDHIIRQPFPFSPTGGLFWYVFLGSGVNS